MSELFDLLKASLFGNNPVHLTDWICTFNEMMDQAVAALPGEWLKTHPISSEWSSYCLFQQGQWVRVIHAQNELIGLLESNCIPSVIIKGAAAAMYYPYPTLRAMGDIDVLVKRKDHEKAADLLEKNGYKLILEKDHVDHHYNYKKNSISIELHRRLPVVDNEDEKLLTMFEDGIDQREWRIAAGSNKFPVLPSILNGLVLIFHINQHLRSGIGLRQIIDWMMYVNQLSAAQWNELRILLKSTGMERLAMTTTVMCQRYLGLKSCFSGCDTVDLSVCDKLMAFILKKGNFGKKAGIKGKIEAFSLSIPGKDGIFKRLQSSGLSQWKAAKKYRILRPFAWLYQFFRILTILVKSKTTPKQVLVQRSEGIEQRKLIEALGLDIDRTIKTT